MPRQRTALRLYRFIALFVLLTLSLIGPFGCSGGSEASAGRGGNQLVPAVEAVPARLGSLPLSERLSGVVRAGNQVELFPEVNAAIVQVFVRNGDLVEAGAPLVRLRDTELREQLNQAEASYQIAQAQAKQAEAENQRIQAELRRNNSLYDQELISPTEFEDKQTQATAAEADVELAHARVTQAQATVDERRDALSRTVVRAPVAGTVGDRNAEIGMLVGPNTRLFTLGKLDSVRVEVVLTDRMLSYIETGQRSEISSPGIPLGTIGGPLTRISPFLHPVTHSTMAEIDLANPDEVLKPGMFVTVDILYGESEKATLVPLSAIWENPATASVGVYVCRDSLTAEPSASLDNPRGGTLSNPVSFDFVPVEIIAKGRMSAGVKGIDPGAWVVTIGQDLIGEDSPTARVRTVNWEWVEKLQQIQREDLLQEIMQRQSTGAVDTSLISCVMTGREGVA